MSFRKFLKKQIHGRMGVFPYFGTRVFFPRNALVFDIACQEGIYEHQLLNHIRAAMKPNSWYFDVGANVGLMSVPILSVFDDVQVVSFEPSRNSSPYLQRTWRESPWKDRWQIVSKAVSDQSGSSDYFLSDSRLGGYDGIKNTRRVPCVANETVETTTLDAEWKNLGCPPVACIKLDIEGAELRALAGGRELIQECRPIIFLEWYVENLRCFGYQPEDLLVAAQDIAYEVAAVPTINLISSRLVLLLQMVSTASFVLVPQDPPVRELHRRPLTEKQVIGANSRD